MLLGKDIRTIKKIKIQGLLNKYDVEVGLLAGSKIIIGANGVGKSTILKIIDCLFRGDFVGLIKYSFKRLDLYYSNILGSDRKIVINYEDLTVPVKIVKAALYNNSLAYFSNDFNKCMVEKLFDEIIDKHILGKFENELVYEEKFSPSIAAVVKHYFDENFLFENCQMKIYSDNESKIICYKEMPFFTTEAFGLLKTYIAHNDSFFYFDLVRNMEIGRDNDQPIIKSNVLTELWKKSNQGENVDFSRIIRCKDDIVSFMKRYLSEDDKVLSFKKTKWNLGKDYINVENCFSECRGVLNEYVFAEKKFYIDGYIFTEFWEIAAKIGKIVDVYLEEYLNSILDEDKKDCNFNFWNGYFGEKEISIYKYCILPFIPKYSPLNCDIKSIINRISNKDLYDARNDVLILDAIKNIYEASVNIMEFIAIINDNKSNEFYFGDLCVYRKYVCEYLEDKNICILPSGLMLFDEKKEKYSEQYDITEYLYTSAYMRYVESEEIIDKVATLSIGKEKNRRYLSELSSGEQKIIILFAIAIFWGGKILVDEPELSLSIVWQERLMRDLSFAGEYSNIIVATHSPYICQDEQLKDDIIYML